MKRIAHLLAFAATILPLPALAWGFEGHQVVADIARDELTPAVRAKVDALLASVKGGDKPGHRNASVVLAGAE